MTDILALFLVPENLIAVSTLTLLEIILNIDNILFIAILAGKLPEEQRQKAWYWGLGIALALRLVMLLGIGWIMSMTEPFIHIFNFHMSGKDLTLLVGGLFLIYKSAEEIYNEVEATHAHAPRSTKKGNALWWAVLGQIILLDLVFSIDSVITAVGMVDHIPLMVFAIVVSTLVMIAAVRPLSRFMKNHPSTKILALAMLLLVGTALMADGLHFHIPRGYIYSAVGFALLVETINIWVRKKRGSLRHIPEV